MDAAKIMKIIFAQKNKAISLLTDGNGNTMTPVSTINHLMDVHFPKSREVTETDLKIPEGPVLKLTDRESFSATPNR
jgi:hypothetical protein